MKCKIKDALINKIECLEEYGSEFDFGRDVNELNRILESYSSNQLTIYDYEILSKFDEKVQNKYKLHKILSYLNRYYGLMNQGNINACLNKSKMLISSLELDRIALYLKMGLDKKMIDKLSDGIENI